MFDHCDALWLPLFVIPMSLSLFRPMIHDWKTLNSSELVSKRVSRMVSDATRPKELSIFHGKYNAHLMDPLKCNYIPLRPLPEWSKPLFTLSEENVLLEYIIFRFIAKLGKFSVLRVDFFSVVSLCVW